MTETDDSVYYKSSNKYSNYRIVEVFEKLREKSGSFFLGNKVFSVFRNACFCFLVC